MMEALCTQQPGWGRFCSETDQNQYTRSQAVSGSVSFSRESDISILTQEGDRITLSVSRESSVTYSAAGTLQDAGTSGYGISKASLLVESSQELSISVEGSLNEEELQDIRTALQLIGRMARTTGTGSLENVAGTMQELGGLGSLADVDARIVTTSAVVVSEQVIAAAVAASASRPGTETQDESAAAGRHRTGRRSHHNHTAFSMPFEKLFSRYAKMMPTGKGCSGDDARELNSLRQA